MERSLKKLLMMIVIALGAWFVYINWDSLTSKPADDYAMDQYKKSMDKAREVEKTLEKAKDRIKID